MFSLVQAVPLIVMLTPRMMHPFWRLLVLRLRSCEAGISTISRYSTGVHAAANCTTEPAWLRSHGLSVRSATLLDLILGGPLSSRAFPLHENLVILADAHIQIREISHFFLDLSIHYN